MLTGVGVCAGVDHKVQGHAARAPRVASERTCLLRRRRKLRKAQGERRVLAEPAQRRAQRHGVVARHGSVVCHWCGAGVIRFGRPRERILLQLELGALRLELRAPHFAEEALGLEPLLAGDVVGRAALDADATV
eukprot:4920226-Prymnesium_polylepis.1